MGNSSNQNHDDKIEQIGNESDIKSIIKSLKNLKADINKQSENTLENDDNNPKAKSEEELLNENSTQPKDPRSLPNVENTRDKKR